MRQLLTTSLRCSVSFKAEIGRVSLALSRYTVKKGYRLSRPQRDVTYQTLLGGNTLNYSRPRRVWLVTSRLGTGESLTFFYSVSW